MENSPAKFIVWLQAARLRTLPLSFSGIITGAAISNLSGSFDRPIFIMSLWCTLLFQVISNFANDYGDGIKGTDNEQRVGPKRVLQSGFLTAFALKKGIVFLSVVALISVVFLLGLVFGLKQWPLFLLFLCLGALSIWAAIRYTVGDKAYGYKGFGDVFVFMFFGLLGVLGSAFLFTQMIEAAFFLPAVVIGCLSVAVLNLNNMRDHINDQKSDKNTLVVRFGFLWAKFYHASLIMTALTASLLFFYVSDFSFKQYISLIVFAPLVAHLFKVWKTQEPKNLDPELKKVAMLTFLWSVLFMLSSNNLL